jgi:chorismate lyase/3-hydroxybenzoate synthase
MPVDVDESERAKLASGHRANVLATVLFGAEPHAQRATPWLEARIPNRRLAPGPAEEVWPAAGAVARIEVGGAPAAADGRSVFVALSAKAALGTALDALAFDVYRRVLRGVAHAGYPHVLRMWNYVPHIHDTSSGIDRYMRFCKGRSRAFAETYGNAFPGRLPAASAVGCPGDVIVVHVLASGEPGRHVENPRQVAAYRYPERYGPKSPSFARGTVAGGAWEGTVFVSGTASIVGHASVFPGDPARQTEETMRNVETVLDAAGVPGRGGPMGARLGSLRVYVRFPDQLDAIRAAIRARAGTAVPTVCLQAEICREELLVEIEATARPQLG